jgi:hypothetical protein
LNENKIHFGSLIPDDPSFFGIGIGALIFALVNLACFSWHLAQRTPTLMAYKGRAVRPRTASLSDLAVANVVKTATIVEHFPPEQQNR